MGKSFDMDETSVHSHEMMQLLKVRCGCSEALLKSFRYPCMCTYLKTISPGLTLKKIQEDLKGTKSVFQETVVLRFNNLYEGLVTAPLRKMYMQFYRLHHSYKHLFLITAFSPPFCAIRHLKITVAKPYFNSLLGAGGWAVPLFLNVYLIGYRVNLCHLHNDVII